MERKFTFKKSNGATTSLSSGSLTSSSLSTCSITSTNTSSPLTKSGLNNTSSSSINFSKSNFSNLSSIQENKKSPTNNFRIQKIEPKFNTNQEIYTEEDNKKFTVSKKLFPNESKCEQSKPKKVDNSPKNKKSKEFNSQINIMSFMQNKTQNKTFKNPFAVNKTNETNSKINHLLVEDEFEEDWCQSQKQVSSLNSTNQTNYSNNSNNSLNNTTSSNFGKNSNKDETHPFFQQKKPTAIVKPELKGKKESSSELLSNLDKEEKNGFQELYKPVKFSTKNLEEENLKNIKKNEEKEIKIENKFIKIENKENIKKEIDDKTICPSCKSEYSSKGPNRRLIDECGHGACFSCVVKSTPCVICNGSIDKQEKEEKGEIREEEKEEEEEEGEEEETIVKHKIDEKSLNETGLTLAQLNEIMESSPEKSPSYSPPDSPILIKNVAEKKKETPRKHFNNDIGTDDIRPLRMKNSAKIFEFGEKISKQFKEETKQNNKNESFELVDLEEEEHFLKSIKNIKTSTQKPKDLDIITLDEPKKDKNKEKDLYDSEGDDDDDDDLMIEEVDLDSVGQKSMSLNSNACNLTKGVYIPDIEKYEKINWLFNDIKDCSPQFRSLEYGHTEELLNRFRNSFGLKQFRPQQFEAVNAALLGLNCFILMPTGGGKSLCYQLPAIITKGVTFVVSPLKSLIIDQVQKLNALGLNAAHMLSDVDSSECDFVYHELVKQEPRYKLVYITPEKLNNSGKLRNIILNLYNRRMISRLVIDEAHCVSQWGHDFRTDYKKMGELRNTLMPNVPVMLLTATATPRVRNDILVQMKLSISENSSLNNNNNIYINNRLDNKLNNRHYMSSSVSLNSQSQKCVFFMQSFNRENLQYKVEYKTSNQAALDKICELIKSRYPNKSGIVYCISRNECESVSEFLRKNQIKALAYHAGLDDKKRQQVQHKWTNNIDCKVVCATIAFGMGIDKPDVRFVFHLGLPKSLEGYYQESGRAGRDGLVSLCYLFYNNQDRHKWLRLMQHEQNGSNFNSVAYKTHVDNIYRMAQYCDNRTDCRRAQILEYFGEKFDRRKCIESKMNTICDNCELQESNQYSITDITADAIIICKGIQQLSFKDDVTLLHLSEILKGSMNSKITEKNHQKLEMHAKLSKYKKNDIERIMRKLIFMGYLKEDVKILQHSETVASYIKLGPKASQLLCNGSNQKIEFEFIDDNTISRAKSKKSKVLKDDDESDESDDDNPKKAKNKLSDSAAINRILLRCQSDLKRLIKKIGSENSVKNTSSIYTPKMLKEMLLKLPDTKEALLGITGYTETIFNYYEGEEFLKIFKHYAKSKEEIQQEELAKLEQEKTEKAKVRAAQSVACYKNSKTYGLVDEPDSIDLKSSSSNWLNSKSSSNYEGTNEYSNKRKYNNNYSGKSYSNKAKKAKTSGYGEQANGEGGGSSSTYFKKKKYNFKNKFKNKNSYKKNY